LTQRTAIDGREYDLDILGEEAPALLRCHAAASLDSASNLAVETWG
jgi:hypothetical protein